MADPSKDIASAVAKIRRQLAVNLDYFSKDSRTTLEILQSHIEEQLKEIETLAGKCDDADTLRKNFAEHLASDYLENPVRIARACDDRIDRTGALLGYVRAAAIRQYGKAG